MLKIERYESRLRSLYFKRRFQERVDEVTPGINALFLACQEVRSSAKLKIIFDMVLAIGNYLNGGTARGAAYGFKANFILKLADTKAADGKSTLLHHLVKILEKTRPGTEDLKTDLLHVEAASKVTMTVILAEVTELRNGVRMIQSELPYHEDKKAGDNFSLVMKTFVEKANKAVDAIEQRISVMVQCEFFFFSLSFFSFPVSLLGNFNSL